MLRGAIRGILLLTAVCCSGAAAAEQSRPLITMGVRVDARPFAWQDPASGSFLGFLVDLCTDAVTRAGYPFLPVPITASERIGVLGGDRPDIDLLCDPTTITLTRLGDFAALRPAGRLSFSPIVFVANGSYLRHDRNEADEEAPEDGAAEAMGGRSDCVASEAPADDGAAPTYALAGYVVGTTIGPILRDAVRHGLLELPAGQSVCPREFQSHSDAAAAFCGGDLDFYFGDADIIASSVLEADNTKACANLPVPRPISYEPYALVISGLKEGFREDFVRALYEVYHDGTAFARFHGHFEDREMSPFLETLFRINQIPAGVPAEDAPATPGEIAADGASGPEEGDPDQASVE